LRTRKRSCDTPDVPLPTPRWLIAWIGRRDLDGAKGSPPSGPVLEFLRALPAQRALLLSNWPRSESARYLRFLRRLVATRCELRHVDLEDPTEYRPIHQAASEALRTAAGSVPLTEIGVHLSPGTPAMAAVWLLICKTTFSGVRLFKGWLDKKSGEPRIAEVEFPFDIAAELLPSYLERQADLLRTPSFETPASFNTIVAHSPVMQRLIATAARAAHFPSPVLIVGESGTGKELLARAIHRASSRSSGPWIPMNCGAMPRELVDAELFGVARGAFTGATVDRTGRFEAADGGVLFLDEVGEMPADTQVRLLRVLQEGEFQRLGETRLRRADVRVLAATNRDLADMARGGHFRSDLFYRLAVIVLRIPPLRDRREDVVRLAEGFLGRLNSRAATLQGATAKRLAPSGREFAKSYDWPGNVRELENTLARIVALSPGDVIRREDFEEHVFSVERTAEPLQGAAPIRSGFSLPEELRRIEKAYIERALVQSGGVQEHAARFLGFRSRQTMAHRMRRLGLR
jgi:DNA-binding NtrC family response regulator